MRPEPGEVWVSRWTGLEWTVTEVTDALVFFTTGDRARPLRMRLAAFPTHYQRKEQRT